jgi:hypothetical protein
MVNARRVRLAGIAYMVGSVLWLVGGAVGLAIWGTDDVPPGSAAFSTVEAVFVLIQLLLLVGFFGVLWSDGIGRSIFGKIAFGIGATGHLLFLAGEAHSLVLGTLSEELIALGALVSAIGMLLTGIVTLAAKRWQGWTRWMPLVAGLYPWLVMFPIFVIAAQTSSVAIVGWGLARLALGVAIYAQATVVSATTSVPRVKLPQGGIQ